MALAVHAAIAKSDRRPMPNIKPNSPRWPYNLDDMRANPSRIVTLADLARLGVVRTYEGARKLPAPLKLPTTPKCWEARSILRAMGLTDTPDSQTANVGQLQSAA